MLRQNVTAMPARSAARAPGPDMAVYACVRLDQKDLQRGIFISASTAALLLLTAADVSTRTERGKQPAVQEDIACAVANIVGGKVKTFLNQQRL